MNKTEFYEFLKTIPKAELHLHAEGAINRDTVHTLLARRDTKDAARIDVDKLFSYNNLKDFLSSFLFVQSLLDRHEDLSLIFEDVATYLRENHIVYCELFFSPTMFLKKGFAFPEMMKVIDAALAKIQKRDKLTIRLIVDVSRSFGVENAQANLNAVLAHRIAPLAGIGLGGDEEKGPAKEFGGVFTQAKAAGLFTVAHAGEVVGPQSIWDAVDVMKVSRIGHGLSATQDPALVKHLAKKQIPIEICVTSNIITQKYVTKAEDHPVRQLFDAGVLCVVNTDDPTFFNCSLIDEFWTLHTKLNFSMAEIKKLVLNAFDASILSAAEKASFKAQVEKAWTSLPA